MVRNAIAFPLIAARVGTAKALRFIGEALASLGASINGLARRIDIL